MIKKLLFSAMICVAYAGAEVVNGVIAVVDNEPITNYELVKVQKLTGASPQAAMEILIGQKLQQSEIKRRGIAVNDAEIGARFKAIADQNKLSVDQLKTAIQREGMNYEDFKTNIRRALLEEKLYNSIFADIQRKTTPENVKKFYTQNSSLFTTFDSITLTRYIAKSQAQLDKIRANPKLRPGDVYVMKGTLKANQMDEGLKYIVTNVEQGKFSPIIPTRNGYEMFYVNDKKGLRTLDFDSVQEKAIEGYVTSERKKAVTEFNDRLRSNANIRIIERPQAKAQKSAKNSSKVKVQKRQ